MNTTTTATQHINHPTTREAASRRSEHAGTGRPPPRVAKPAKYPSTTYQGKSSGRPGVLGRKQSNHKPETGKDAGRGKNLLAEERFDGERLEENVPDLAGRGASTSSGISIGIDIGNGRNNTGIVSSNAATSTSNTGNNSTAPTAANNANTTANIPTPVNRTMPMLMSNRDLPGPLSMNRLDDFGAVHQLDDINAYLAEYSNTLFGRGIIMTKVVPRRSIACGRSALWVWMGGAFPDAIDIISNSHFRSMAYGRSIRTYARNVPEGQMSSIAGLKVTSPTRTACDIALMSPATIPDKRRAELTCAIVQEYHIDPAECLTILEKNHFWPNVPQARQFFKAVQYCF